MAISLRVPQIPETSFSAVQVEEGTYYPNVFFEFLIPYRHWCSHKPTSEEIIALRIIRGPFEKFVDWL
jgi:hypothetical protein